MAAQFVFLAMALIWSVGIVTYCISKDQIWWPSDKHEDEQKETTKKVKEKESNCS